MSDKRISIELTEEQADLLAHGAYPYDDRERNLSREITDAARAALAAHRRSTRAERLDSPWVVQYDPPAGRAVELVAAESGSLVAYVYGEFGEERARLMAAAPTLAEALEGLLEATEDWLSGDAPEQTAAREALRLSGWSDGGGE